MEDIKARIEKRLFLARLPHNTSEDELREAFSQFGELAECKLVPGRNLGFVGFETWAATHRALVATDNALSLPGHSAGHTLLASFAERTHSVGRGGGADLAKGQSNSRIFISGLPEDVTEGELRHLFSPFGQVEGVKLLPARAHRCCGFVTFSIWGEALDAIEAMHKVPYPQGGTSQLTVVLAEPREPAASRSESEVHSRGGRDVGHGATNTKRRRRDGAGWPAEAFLPDFEQLKAMYLDALEGGATTEECTALHWELMRVREAVLPNHAASPLNLEGAPGIRTSLQKLLAPSIA